MEDEHAYQYVSLHFSYGFCFADLPVWQMYQLIWFSSVFRSLKLTLTFELVHTQHTHIHALFVLSQRLSRNDKGQH